MASDYKNRKWSIVPYDQKWKDAFKQEAEVLARIFGDNVIVIEHIGSTSVPGLAGKPTIDILIIVDDISGIDALNPKMEAFGYEALGEHTMPGGTRLFIKEHNNERLYHVHIFQKNHSHIKEMLDLRNYFRSHPKIVKEYSQLKFDLFKKYPNDYALYRKEKDKWMEKLKEKIKT